MFLTLYFKPVKRTAYGFKQGCLTTAVRAADKYNRAVVIHCQVEVERLVGLEIAYLYFLYEHDFKFIY